MKEKEKHSYFWLIGAGGPGNRRKRTALEEKERKMLIHLKHRAEALGLPFDLSLGDIRIPDRCPVFGFRFVKIRGRNGGNPRSLSVDRIIPSRGYAKGNVVIVSLKANVIKETSSLAQMKRRLKALKNCVNDLTKVIRFYEKINKRGRN